MVEDVVEGGELHEVLDTGVADAAVESKSMLREAELARRAVLIRLIAFIGPAGSSGAAAAGDPAEVVANGPGEDRDEVLHVVAMDVRVEEAFGSGASTRVPPNRSVSDGGRCP